MTKRNNTATQMRENKRPGEMNRIIFKLSWKIIIFSIMIFGIYWKRECNYTTLLNVIAIKCIARRREKNTRAKKHYNRVRIHKKRVVFNVIFFLSHIILIFIFLMKDVYAKVTTSLSILKLRVVLMSTMMASVFKEARLLYTFLGNWKFDHY